MNKKELEQLKVLSDALYHATNALAIAGKLISAKLESAKQDNQLELDIPNGLVINYVFDKCLTDTFREGTDEEVKMMEDAYDNIRFVPTLGSEHAAAYDIRAYLPPNSFNKVGTFSLYPMATKIISTNLMVEVPIGYELIITPRSGLAVKGITVSNSPGTIDADYRGVVGVILYNNSGEPFEITHGDRIAQCKLKKLEATTWKQVDKLSETARGKGGFGSTGVK